MFKYTVLIIFGIFELVNTQTGSLVCPVIACKSEKPYNQTSKLCYLNQGTLPEET